MRRSFSIVLLAVALGGCGQERGGSGTAGLREDIAADAADDQPASAPATLAVAMPRIAYSYSYGFQVPEAELAPLVRQHRALCDRMGPQRCRLVGLEQGTGEGAYPTAKMELQVAAAEATRFGTELGRAATAAGGRTVDTTIGAEDLSKQMVDTAARIRTKEQVVGRLSEILRTRTGNVAQLVEAEKAIAQAQEELEAARGWMAQMAGRVAMSKVQINYSAATRTGNTLPSIGESLGRSFAAFGQSLAVLLNLLILLLPWVLLGGSVLLAVRAYRRRTAERATRADTDPVA